MESAGFAPPHTLLSKLHLPTEDEQRGTALRGAHVSCPRVARSSRSSFEWMNKEFGGLGVCSKQASSFQPGFISSLGLPGAVQKNKNTFLLLHH